MGMLDALKLPTASGVAAMVLKDSESNHWRDVLSSLGTRQEEARAKHAQLTAAHEAAAAKAAAGDEGARKRLVGLVKALADAEDALKALEAAERGAHANLEAAEEKERKNSYREGRQHLEEKTTELLAMQSRTIEAFEKALAEMEAMRAKYREVSALSGPMSHDNALWGTLWHSLVATLQARCGQHHEMAAVLGMPIRKPGSEMLGGFGRFADPKVRRESIMKHVLLAFDKRHGSGPDDDQPMAA